MADISTYISQIMSAVYGEEVRGSIRDALVAINNEGNAMKTRSIDGFFLTQNKLSRYFLCSSDASASSKIINAHTGASDEYNFESPEGMIVLVKFLNGNTANPPSIRLVLVGGIASSVSAPIYYRGAFLPSADSIKAGGTYIFVYVAAENEDAIDRWELIGDLSGLDAYSSIHVLERSSGSLNDIGISAEDSSDAYLALGSGLKALKNSPNNIELSANLAAGEGVNITENQQTGQLTISADATLASTDVPLYDLVDTYGDVNYEVRENYRLVAGNIDTTTAYESAEGYRVVKVKNFNKLGTPTHFSITLDYAAAGDTPASDTVAVALDTDTNPSNFGPGYPAQHCIERMVVRSSDESAVYEFNSAGRTLMFTLSPGMNADLSQAINGSITLEPVTYLRAANNGLKSHVDNVHTETIDINELIDTGVCDIHDGYKLSGYTTYAAFRTADLVADTNFAVLHIKNLAALGAKGLLIPTTFNTSTPGISSESDMIYAVLTEVSGSITPTSHPRYNAAMKVSRYNNSRSLTVSDSDKSILIGFYTAGTPLRNFDISGTITLNIKNLMFEAIKTERSNYLGLAERVALLEGNYEVEPVIEEGGSENG